MIYKLYYSDANTLLHLPETGMGYQIVEAQQYNKFTQRKFVIYNSELAIDFDENFQNNKRQVFSRGFKDALSASETLILNTNSIHVLAKASLGQFSSLSVGSSASKKRHSGGKGANESPKEYASGSEVFIRLSAYEDDKRIDITNKKLKPGSYTTTKFDYDLCVSTGDDPVDRYALPNDEEIKWAFYIRPLTSDQLQRGIVQPAFSHAGGGIEAYFENGTSNNTYFDKRTYGK